MTATSLRGQNESVPDATGSNFVNRRHDVGFRFHTNPGGGAGDFSDTTPDGPLVRNLATAGRASASFPVAFEPVLVDPTDFGRGKGVAEWLSEPRYLADGGILDNLPVGPAVKAIFHQPADEPITRVLLAVIPLHQEERPDAGAQPVSDEPSHPYSTFSVTWSAGVTIPRNETIAAELRELERLNRDSGLLINARTVLLDRPFDELVATGRGLWPLYVRQHMPLLELAAGDDERGTARERGPELPHRGVETEGGELEDPVSRSEGQRNPLGGEEIGQAAVGGGHSLGPPRGAGRIDKVGQTAGTPWREAAAAVSRIDIGAVHAECRDARGQP